MGTAPSAAAVRTGTDAPLPSEKHAELETARTTLDSLRDTIAKRHASDISDSIRLVADNAAVGLATIGTFIEEAPHLRSLTEFQDRYSAAVAHARDIARGIPPQSLELLAVSERAILTEHFKPFVTLAQRYEEILLRGRDSFTAQVVNHQEQDYLRAGLRAIEANVLTSLERDLRSIAMLGDTRRQIVSYVRTHLLHPFMEPLNNDPLHGDAGHTSLAATLERIRSSKEIEIAPGQFVLLGEERGTPKILRAINAATERLTHEVEQLTTASIGRSNVERHLRELRTPYRHTLPNGLTVGCEYRWASAPHAESCVLTLESPWGDRGSYRYELRPVPGEEELFRREVVSLRRDLEASSHPPTNDARTQMIEFRLHRLGGVPSVEVAPLRTVEALLRTDGEKVSVPLPPEDARAGIRRALEQSFSFAPLRIGSEGADYGRVNRIGFNINRGTATVTLFREGYNGTVFESTPAIELTTTDIAGACNAVRTITELLQVSRGNVAPSDGGGALATLLRAQRSPVLGHGPLFEVTRLANVSIVNASNISIHLAPDAEVANVVLRGSSVSFKNADPERSGEITLTNIAADGLSRVQLALNGAHLDRLNLNSVQMRCRDCTAERVSINHLTPESVAAWSDPRHGNRFVDSRTDRIVRTLSNRVAGFFGGEPEFSMRSSASS